jgi:RHS repeat-associated protein
MAYDGENRQKTATQIIEGTPYTHEYFYDGEGRRVKKLLSSGATTVYVHDAFGRLAAEYTTEPPPVSEVLYVTGDHSGSVRLVTKASTDPDPMVKVAERHDYRPYGEELFAGTGGRTTAMGYPDGSAAPLVNQQFTGKERDAETGLDYFGARYFSGAQGRFTSVDPLLESADPSNPQSWNRYTYALNNPLRYVDRDGQIPVETVLDVASLGMSLRDLVRNPSWAAAGYALWDAGALALPYVPGSWVALMAASPPRAFAEPRAG